MYQFNSTSFPVFGIIRLLKFAKAVGISSILLKFSLVYPWLSEREQLFVCLKIILPLFWNSSLCLLAQLSIRVSIWHLFVWFFVFSEFLSCVGYVCYMYLFLVHGLCFYFICDAFEKQKFLFIFHILFIMLSTDDSCFIHWQKQPSLLAGPSLVPGKPTQANASRISHRNLLLKYCWLSDRYFNPQHNWQLKFFTESSSQLWPKPSQSTGSTSGQEVLNLNVAGFQYLLLNLARKIFHIFCWVFHKFTFLS